MQGRDPVVKLGRRDQDGRVVFGPGRGGLNIVQRGPGLDEGALRGKLGVTVVRLPEDADGELFFFFFLKEESERDGLFYRVSSTQLPLPLSDSHSLPFFPSSPSTTHLVKPRDVRDRNVAEHAGKQVGPLVGHCRHQSTAKARAVD